MEILGLVFVGSATPQRAEMASFVRDVLGLREVAVTGGMDAELFDLPDGTRFAVADEREPGQGTSRTVGLLVADVAVATDELRAAGVDVTDPAEGEGERYAHFVAPDGRLYELIERRQT